MRAKLEDVCVRSSSSLKQSDVIDKIGEYPIYGAAGYIAMLISIIKINHMLLFVKDWGRYWSNIFVSSKVFSDWYYAVFITKRKCVAGISLLCCEIYALRKIFYRCDYNHISILKNIKGRVQLDTWIGRKK